MGNILVSPCLRSHNSSPSSSITTLIFWEGPTRVLKGKHIAGEIMFEFPEKMVCHADSFFIGHPIPVLAIDDDLMPGQTYFVLPLDRFSCNVLTVASLAALNHSSIKSGLLVSSGECPFVYIKGEDGRILIKVVPEFIVRVLNKGNKEEEDGGGSCGFLCSTPELRKHYEQLVGCKEKAWSPKLEAISEHKIRFSPCRFIEWKEKEKDHGY